MSLTLISVFMIGFAAGSALIGLLATYGRGD